MPRVGGRAWPTLPSPGEGASDDQLNIVIVLAWPPPHARASSGRAAGRYLQLWARWAELSPDQQPTALVMQPIGYILDMLYTTHLITRMSGGDNDGERTHRVCDMSAVAMCTVGR